MLPHPHPHPPTIPGLFQIPPPLESDPAPFDYSRPYPASRSQIPQLPPTTTTRSSFTTPSASTSAARHDHNLTFAGQISSYSFPHHGDHYSQQARTYPPPSLRPESHPAYPEPRRRLTTTLSPPLTASASPASPQAPDLAASARPSPFSPSSRAAGEYVQSDRVMVSSLPRCSSRERHPFLQVCPDVICAPPARTRTRPISSIANTIPGHPRHTRPRTPRTPATRRTLTPSGVPSMAIYL